MNLSYTRTTCEISRIPQVIAFNQRIVSSNHLSQSDYTRIYNMDNQEVFLCQTCGASYKSRKSLLQHQRLRCSPPEDAPSFQCQHCPRSFLTYAGQRQHERLVHIQAYNAELEAAGSKSKTRPWSQLEILDMINLEIQYEGRQINIDLATKLNRKPDNVKYQRRLLSYRMELTRIRSERSEAEQDPSPPPTPSPQTRKIRKH